MPSGLAKRLVKKRKSQANDHCYCKSGKRYNQCCKPLHQGIQTAATPQQLMRSRYSAYVKNNKEYLLSTWHIDHRPETLSLDEQITWISLDILEAPLPDPDDQTAYVLFEAVFIENTTLVTLREKSTFTRFKESWQYVTGKPEISQRSLSMNGACPCGSKMKFKRCCLVS